MKPITSIPRLERRLFGTAVFIASIPLFAALAAAQDTGTRAFTDPAEIDRTVARFTGAATGEVGGARLPADPRLRLAACATPLAADWHGPARTSVAVSCAGPDPWRIFIGTRPAAQAQAAQRAVTRGDPVTVVVRGRGFTVQQSGEAMEHGAVGDWIAIRTNRQGEPIRARIERPGLAVIN